MNNRERWYYIFGISARGSLSQPFRPHHSLCGGNTLRPRLYFCVLTTELSIVKPADSRAAAAGSPEQQQQQQQRVAILPCRAADAGAPLPLAASPALDGTFMILFSWHKGHISPGNCILSVEPFGGLLTQSCMCACASDTPLDIRNRQFSSNRHRKLQPFRTS